MTRDLSAEDILTVRGGGGSAELSRFDKARESSTVRVVTSVGGPNPSGFGPALTSPLVTADRSRHVRGSSPPSDETDTGSDATRNDKQRRVKQGERRQQVEFEEELRSRSRSRRFACTVGDCRRRYRNIDKLGKLCPFKFPSEIPSTYLIQVSTITIRALMAQLDENYSRQDSTNGCSIPS